MKPVLSAQEAVALAAQPLTIVFDVEAGPQGQDRFSESHFQGAQWVDLETDLSATYTDAALLGRHPLPTPEAFVQTLGRLGATRNSTILLYDRSGGVMAAARMWWMLRSLGHEQVAVVDGGWAALQAAGAPVSTGKADEPKAQNYDCPNAGWNWPLVEMGEVLEKLHAPSSILIDVRAANRYAGLVEPIDLLAGHIPGAVNVPLGENLRDGYFVPREEIATRYQGLFEQGDVTVHCGSGVTACHTILAMAHAGLPVPKLYNGSWSQWSRNNLPMELGANDKE